MPDSLRYSAKELNEFSVSTGRQLSSELKQHFNGQRAISKKGRAALVLERDLCMDALLPLTDMVNSAHVTAVMARLEHSGTALPPDATAIPFAIDPYGNELWTGKTGEVHFYDHETDKYQSACHSLSDILDYLHPSHLLSGHRPRPEGGEHLRRQSGRGRTVRLPLPSYGLSGRPKRQHLQPVQQRRTEFPARGPILGCQSVGRLRPLLSQQQRVPQPGSHRRGEKGVRGLHQADDGIGHAVDRLFEHNPHPRLPRQGCRQQHYVHSSDPQPSSPDHALIYATASIP